MQLQKMGAAEDDLDESYPEAQEEQILEGQCSVAIALIVTDDDGLSKKKEDKLPGRLATGPDEGSGDMDAGISTIIKDYVQGDAPQQGGIEERCIDPDSDILTLTETSFSDDEIEQFGLETSSFGPVDLDQRPKKGSFEVLEGPPSIDDKVGAVETEPVKNETALMPRVQADDHSNFRLYVTELMKDIAYAVRNIGKKTGTIAHKVTKASEGPRQRGQDILSIIRKELNEFKFTAQEQLMDLKYNFQEGMKKIGIFADESAKQQDIQEKVKYKACSMAGNKYKHLAWAIGWTCLNARKGISYNTEKDPQGNEFLLKLEMTPSDHYSEPNRSLDICCYLHDERLDDATQMKSLRQVYRIHVDIRSPEVTSARFHYEEQRDRKRFSGENAQEPTHTDRMNRLLRRLDLTASSNMYGIDATGFYEFITHIYDTPDIMPKDIETLDKALNQLHTLSRCATESNLERLAELEKENKTDMAKHLKTYKRHVKALSSKKYDE
ncbi:MAG: hypothetical protein ABIA62_01860 [Candidatus Woesearchaeota archaeon]